MTRQPNNVNRLVQMIVAVTVIVIGIAVLIMPQAQGEDNAVFKGYVTERGSGSTIEGAQVNLWGDSEGNTTYTDASGYFEMNIPDGGYHVHVEKEGYWDHDNPISIGFGEVRDYDVTLAPETAVIKGHVTDEDSSGPIENASVTVWDGEIANSTQTDSSGYYEMNAVSGYFSIMINADGYTGYSEEIDVNDSDIMQIDVSLREETSMIKGYVTVDDTRSALEGAYAGVYGEYDDSNVTDDEGYFELTLASGDFYFYVWLDGYTMHFEEIHIGDYEVHWRNISLMEEKATVKGYIMDDSRGPIENMNIEFDNQSAQMHQNAQTDDQGYFERTLVSGDWHVDIAEWGYYTYREDFTVADDETKWFNITMESATMVHVDGHVKVNGTNDPITDEWIHFYTDRYDAGTVTDDQGYYELWFASDLLYEIYLGVQGYMSYEDDVYVFEDMTYDIILEPIPPTDMTVKGYVSSYETRGPIEATVATMSMAFDGNTGTTSDDETGYFEFEAWSGLGVIMSIAQDYYMFFAILNFTDGEMWYNITLYPELDDDSTLDGTIIDAKGDPVEGAKVLLVNYMTGVPVGDGDDGPGNGIPHSTETDDNGYYEMDVPNGDWYLMVDADGETGVVQEVTINGDFTKDLTLPEAIFANEMSVVFLDWDTIDFTNQGPFEFDSSAYLTRLQIDFMVGNQDGSVNESEADAFEELMESMSDSDDGFDEENTTDEFSVDDIFYNFLLDTVTYGLSNMEGAITSLDPPHMEMNGKIESQEQIPEGDVHVILLNTSYEEEDDDGPENLTIILPEGFILEDYEATENVSVEGLGTDTIRVTFVGEPVEDTWEWVTLTAMVINILPTVDAGEDQVVTVNDNVQFLANGSDTDGEIVLYEWDFDYDGTFVANHSSANGTANFSYTTTGVFTAMVRVTDNRGGTAEDTINITVDPIVILLANLQIDSLVLSDPKPEDGDEVEISVTLKNTGNTDAINIKVRINIDDKLEDLINVGDIAPGTSFTVNYTWTASEGHHTILINMTYSEGGDESELKISVKSEGDGSSFIPGFELMMGVIAIVAVACLVQWQRKD